MKVSLLISSILLVGCAHRPHVELVKKMDDGGMISYPKNLQGPRYKLDSQVASLVQCPKTFVIENPVSADEPHQFFYSCDSALGLERAVYSENCSKGDSVDCMKLALSYQSSPAETERMNAMFTQVCMMEKSDPRITAYACNLAGFTEILEHKNKPQAIKYLGKSCDQYGDQLESNPYSLLSCGFKGAYTKDKALFERAMAKLQGTCQSGDSCYNVSCLYSAYGDYESALKYLHLALSKGFREWDHLAHDPDMDNIRNDPKYKELIDTYKSRSPASRD